RTLPPSPNAAKTLRCLPVLIKLMKAGSALRIAAQVLKRQNCGAFHSLETARLLHRRRSEGREEIPHVGAGAERPTIIALAMGLCDLGQSGLRRRRSCSRI